MIIDGHVHVYPPEVVRYQEHISEKEPYFDLLTHGKVHRWSLVEDVLSHMEENGIDQSWICGFAFSDPGLCRLCNDYIAEAVRRYPTRLRGLCVVNPTAPGFEKEMFRCAEAGFIGVGELFPQGQGFDLSESRETWRLAGACHEANLFALIHTAEPVGHDYPGKGNVGPKEAAAFCANHPEVEVVFAHWGGGLWLYELMPEMKVVLQHAHYDTAATPFLYRFEVYDALFASKLGEKLLFGTDFPILRMERFTQALDRTGLSLKQKESLLGRNHIGLLKSLGKETGPAETFPCG